jgi:hypothetical protein
MVERWERKFASGLVAPGGSESVLGNKLAGGTPNMSRAGSESMSASSLKVRSVVRALCTAVRCSWASGAQNWEGARRKLI